MVFGFFLCVHLPKGRRARYILLSENFRNLPEAKFRRRTQGEAALGSLFGKNWWDINLRYRYRYI